MAEKEISQAVIARLPRYYRYLGELREQGVERISSQELSRIMKVTASQIRQDFNNFGGFGQQGYGYNVNYLCNEIGSLLGINQNHDMILIGAGRMGQAIVNFINYSEMPYTFKGLFDVNEAIFGAKVGGAEVHPMDELEDFIAANNIDLAALTVPTGEAAAIAQRLVDCKIKGIWNFAHVDLPVPSSVVVENVHILDSLMKLSYNLRNK